MHLYFLRHGKAEERSLEQSDFDRRLTEEGIEEMRAEAKGIGRLNLSFDTIFTSPLLRALETAQIVAEELGIKDRAFHVEERLASGVFGMGNLQALLESQPAESRILLVGHEPDFSETAGRLVGGAVIDLKKGGLIYIVANRIEPGYGVLRWLLTPKHLIT